MSYCQNCGSEASGKFCPNCGQPVEELVPMEPSVVEEPPVETFVEEPGFRKKKKKGKVSTIIGFVFMALCDIAAVCVLFAGIFRNSSMTFLEQVVDGVASCGMLIVLGAWFFGYVKWIAFAVPKTFRAAKAIVRNIIPLSIIAFGMELVAFLGISLIPISLGAVALTPLTLLIEFLDAHPKNLLYPTLLIAVAGVGTYFLVKYFLEKHFGVKISLKKKETVIAD